MVRLLLLSLASAAAPATAPVCQTVNGWTNGPGKDDLGTLHSANATTVSGCCAACQLHGSMAHAKQGCLTWTLRPGACWLHGKSHNPTAHPNKCTGCVTGNNGGEVPLPPFPLPPGPPGPKPPPPPSGGGGTPNSTEVLGAINFLADESTPVVFGGRLPIMETIGYCYPYHVRLDHPGLGGAACPGYVQVRDLQSGHVVANLTGPGANSCNHSFAAAFVDTDPSTGAETMYIYAARSPRFQVSQPWCNHSGIDNHGGHDACWGHGDHLDCAIDIYSSSDLMAWHASPTPFRTNGTRVSNVDVTPVPAAALAHTRDLPADTKYLMVLATSGKLAASASPVSGWRYVEGVRAQHQGASGAASGPVNCMSMRYGDDGYWYILGGGVGVSITRSRDLVTWQGGTHAISSCRDARDRRPARFPGLYDWAPWQWEHGPPDVAGILSSGSRGGRVWDRDASDVDLTEWARPGLPTVTVSIHWCGDQHTTWFTIASVFNGTQTQWLASFFGPDES
jgi:hypothetical protein